MRGKVKGVADARMQSRVSASGQVLAIEADGQLCHRNIILSTRSHMLANSQGQTDLRDFFSKSIVLHVKKSQQMIV